jgi:hypothetical protein
MLLRRVIEHVRDQNWTAIAIDFCIVVIGVFVGIQVANWNAARADERLGRAYAARLATDLTQDLATRRALADYFGAVLDSVERTDALLADPLAEPQALVVAAYRASEINYVPPSRATWDEIVSSGDTGLLPSEAARHAADYFAFDTPRDSFEGLTASAYRRTVRTVISLGVQKALRAGCSDVRNEAQQITGFMPGCKLDVAPDTLRATAAALRADPAVQANLRYQYSEVYSTHVNIGGDVVLIERALAALKGLPPPAGAAP